MANLFGFPDDHVVKVHKSFLVVLFTGLVLAPVVAYLMFWDNQGPDPADLQWPGVNRYALFAASCVYFTHIYCLVSTLVFPAIYNCWIVLFFCVYQLLVWVTATCDIILRYRFYWFEGGPEVANETPASREWRLRYTTKLYIAGCISALLTITAYTLLFLFVPALNRHRLSGAPYLTNSMWRNTASNPQSIPLSNIEAGTRNYHRTDYTGNIRTGVQNGESPAHPTQNHESSAQGGRQMGSRP